MIYIVMGVSGCGKSTVGLLLAKQLNIAFYDADDFHPVNNINKILSYQSMLPLKSKISSKKKNPELYAFEVRSRTIFVLGFWV